MSTELSDLGELHRALSATVQLEKVERKAALAAHTMATKRIFPASLFLISGRRGSRLSNDEVADKLEDQYTTLGHIFDKTKEEEEYHAKMLEKYQGELLNK